MDNATRPCNAPERAPEYSPHPLPEMLVPRARAGRGEDDVSGERRRTAHYVVECDKKHTKLVVLPTSFRAQRKHPVWLEGCAKCFGPWRSAYMTSSPERAPSTTGEATE